MPPITWRNIATPSFTGAMTAQAAAGEKISEAFDPLQKILTDRQKLDETNFETQTKQNTLDLEAQFRGATSINELEQMSNPEMLRQQLGAMYDPAVIDTAAETQRSKIRTDNTNTFLQQVRSREGGELPKSNTEIAALLQGADPKEVNIEEAQTALTQGLAGRREDVTFTREQEKFQRSDALRMAKNTYLEIFNRTGSDEDATFAMLDTPGIDKAEALKEKINLNVAATTPDVLENQQYQNFVNNAATGTAAISSQIEGEISGLNRQLSKVSAISDATTKQYEGILAKGTNPTSEMIARFTEGWIDSWGDPADYVNSTKTSLVEQGINPGDAELIILQAANNTTQTEGWTGANIDQTAFQTEIDRIVQQRTISNRLKENIFQLQQTAKQVTTQMASAIQAQAGEKALQIRDPRFKDSIDEMFKPASVENIVSGLNQNITILKEKLKEAQKANKPIKTIEKELKEWGSTGKQRTPKGASGIWGDTDAAQILGNQSLQAL